MAEGGLIEIIYKKDVGKKILPGGKKNEYILAKEGVAFKKEMIRFVLKLFKPVLDSIYKKREPLKSDGFLFDEDDVQNFVMEISDDINPHARSPESTEAIQEILIKNLTRFLTR